ncbi:hypothetical protein Tco_1045770 [Tanacetum coccineum]|uniref:Uncharacterized protein n=1 Tax=Tanacetum coccineum TaxID=301880 RepID=A0ABQ5GUK3_9ASTR
MFENSLRNGIAGGRWEGTGMGRGKRGEREREGESGNGDREGGDGRKRQGISWEGSFWRSAELWGMTFGCEECYFHEQSMKVFLIGRHLDEYTLNLTHLEKKRTRLRTNTKTLKDLCSQSLETASQAIHDAVTTHQVTASHHFMTASARTDSNADLEDSSYDGVTTKTRRRRVVFLIYTNSNLGF